MYLWIIFTDYRNPELNFTSNISFDFALIHCIVLSISYVSLEYECGHR